MPRAMPLARKRPTLRFCCGSWRERSGPAPRRSPRTPEHPARRWLAARHLWRPDLQLPPSVRWLQAEGPPSVGGLLAAFAPPGQLEPSGVQLVSVDVDGRPAPDIDGPDGLAMRSIGAMRGAVCVLGRPAADGGVNVAEGLDDALALAARLPWPAVSAGGRGGFFDVDLARWLPSLSAVDVWPTLDEAGIEAARTLTRRVARLGGVSGIQRVVNGTTPAEAGGPFAPLDAAAVESSAADLERGGLPTWEARRLASVILGQVLHLADGTLPATREGIPRPAPAGSSPLSDRIGPKPPFSRSTAKTPTR